MTETAELRWFFPGALPEAAEAWFRAAGGDAPVEVRTDRYLVPASDGCGRKHREGRAEVKTRTGTAAPLAVGSAAGTPEHWRKETVETLPDGPALDVAKRRRTSELETPEGTCTLELSAVEACGETWWSVCLEATAPTASARERTLRAAARRWLTHPETPALPAGAACAYPAWLRDRCGT